jgi:glycosyltransferase involved in cell wall biosynthesis
VRISVLVPCYNAAAYLADALDSVLAQRPAPDEVIVVDDGSADGSLAIARRYEPRVRVHAAEHRGISATRNECLRHATGDVIAFLDADDLWTPASLACRAAVLTSDSPFGYVSGYVEQFISEELPEDTRRRLVCPPDRLPGGVLGAMLIRGAAFDAIGAFDTRFRVGESIDWIARAQAAGISSHLCEETVLRRRIHGANTGTTQRDARTDYLRVLKASLDRQRAMRGSA